MKLLPVSLGDRSYDIHIAPGRLDDTGKLCQQVLPRATRLAVVTDDTVGGLYAHRLLQSLWARGYTASVISLPAGEQTKSLYNLGVLYDSFMEMGLTRTDAVVALGGGVVGDLAGFAAAAYMRGVDCVQIPTTLLAAVDSSVGGKTAVDLPQGKNLAGAFHQPKLVLCDTDILGALPEALMRDGAAEMIKCGVLRDAALFEAMADGSWSEDLEGAVARCVSIKRDYVDQDPFDNGARQFLNLGHTFGHAVEKSTNFALSHGQCVAIGMVMAFRAAGLDEAPIVRAARACGLPTQSPCSADELCAAAALDKKRRGDTVTLVLPERIGACALRRVPVGQMRAYILRGLGEGVCA